MKPGIVAIVSRLISNAAAAGVQANRTGPRVPAQSVLSGREKGGPSIVRGNGGAQTTSSAPPEVTRTQVQVRPRGSSKLRRSRRVAREPAG